MAAPLIANGLPLLIVTEEGRWFSPALYDFFAPNVQEVFVEEYNGAAVKGVTSNFQQVLLENAPKNVRGLVRAKITRCEKTVCYGEII